MIWRLELFEYFLHDLWHLQNPQKFQACNFEIVVWFLGLLVVFSTNYTLSTADLSLFGARYLTFVKIYEIYIMHIMLRLCPFHKHLKKS